MLTFWTLVKWLHVVGAVIWLGGVFFVVFMLRPALAATPDPQLRRTVLGGAVKRMRRIMNHVVAAQVATGLYMLWVKLGGWEVLFTSPWGRVLLAKVVAALLMIGLYVVVPRLLLSQPEPSPEPGCCSGGQAAAPLPSPRQRLGHMLHLVMLMLGGVVLLLAKMLT